MKRIVICADGTWNLRDQPNEITGTRRPTNVTKVARAVLPRDDRGVDQVVYYHDGVGTRGKWDQITGGAFGRGIERNIAEMYRFIAYNHAPGDELYFFGFSRGAFTVRTLAGFLNFVGLAEKDDDYYVPEMYDCYENHWGPGSAQWNHLFVDDPQDKGPRKRKTRVQGQRPCPPMKFIGVWDTVGALGAPGLVGKLFNQRRYENHQPGLNDNIQNAIHALAIDERRKLFKPTLFAKAGPTANWPGRLVQAWFAGVHSDIGGGYEDDSLANTALHWVLSYAGDLGLQLDKAYLHKFWGNAKRGMHDSLGTMYKLMGPLDREIGTQEGGEEFVHRSALDRLAAAECNYRPPMLLAHQKSASAGRVLPPA